jgi:hypothetical protein
MFNLRKGRTWCATRLDSDAFAGFFLGSTTTLALVLMVNFLRPTSVVEKRALEAAKQALYWIFLP